MKTSKIIIGLIILTVLTSINSLAQQETTLTTTRENLTASKATIDMAGLVGNPQAIIIAAPIGETAKLNPHPIGAWYYNEKWNIFNTDHATMPAGLKFKVEVFLKPDANHFLHSITKENLTGDTSYIDNPALNNNPNAQVTIFQNHAPDYRSSPLNKYEAKAEYDQTAGKWTIKNVNGEQLFPNTAYNVFVTSGIGIINPQKLAVTIPELITNPQGKTVVNSPCNCLPSGNAGGDLGGTFPNPTVQKLNGRPLSNIPPKAGQLLRWSENTNAWVPDNAYSISGTGLSLDANNTLKALNTTPIWNANQLAGRDILPTAPTIGQVLRWNGTAWEPSGTATTSTQPNDAATRAIIEQMLAKKKEAEDAIAGIATSAPADKPTFLFYTQTTSQNAEVNLSNKTTIIPGLNNQFFTLTKSSRVIFHSQAALINTNSAPFANGGTGKVIVQILTNTSNAVVAVNQSQTALFPGKTVSSNFTGFAILPAGTYYTKVSIASVIDEPFKVFASQLLIEIFPE